MVTTIFRLTSWPASYSLSVLKRWYAVPSQQEVLVQEEQFKQKPFKCSEHMGQLRPVIDQGPRSPTYLQPCALTCARELLFWSKLYI